VNDWSLSLSPIFPVWLYAALGLAALAAVALTARTRPRAALGRAVVAALLLFALSDPALKREDRRPLKDIVAVVVDHSGSNRIGERPQQTEAARAEVLRQLGTLDNVEAHVVDTPREDPDNKGTELFAALRQALADSPPERIGGAIFITDGVAHDAPAKAADLGFNAPLHVLVTGHAGERDRRIELVEAPRFGIVGKNQTIVARIDDSDDHGEPAEIAVRRDGQQIATVQARVGERVEIPAPVDHAGDNIFELEVAELPNELTAANNKAIVTIDGVRDKLRVLLVSGEPHPGERMWRNLLKSDANVDLVHFTILRPPDKSTDGAPINELSLIAFPVADLFGRKIKDFDLIIFDRYSTQSVLPQVYLDNIVRYVKAGGAVMLAVGPEFETPEGLYNTPIGSISPAQPTGEDLIQPFKPEISPDGLKHPVTRGLAGSDASPPAWGTWYRAIGAKLGAGSNIMQAGDGAPLLALQRIEKGRVALLLSDQIWLWARGYDGGGPYLDLLRRLAHWLMKEPELEEEALRARAHGADITVERQSLKDEIPPVTLTGPDGASRAIALQAAAPGLARAIVHVEDNGLYRASDGEHIALVNVGPENPLELQEVVSTTEKLRALAESTGGSSKRLGDPAAVPHIVAMHESPIYAGSGFLAIKRTGASALIGVSRWPMAEGFAGLAVLIGALVLMWLAESGRSWRGRG
jgi:hypothetical protein